MFIPKSFTLFGKQWTVVVRKLKGVCGYCHADKTLVEITPPPYSSPDTVKETFIHEMIHGLEHDLSIDLEETEVARLAVGIFAFMRENPKIVAWLLEKDVR